MQLDVEYDTTAPRIPQNAMASKNLHSRAQHLAKAAVILTLSCNDTPPPPAASSAASSLAVTAALANSNAAPQGRFDRLTPAAANTKNQASSELVLARLGKRRIALIADEDDQQVRALSLPDGAALATFQLHAAPAQLLLARNGQLFVSLRDAASVVQLALQETGEAPLQFVEQRRISTADEPTALGFAHQENTLLVSCGWGRSLMAHSLTERGRNFAAPLAQEPRGFAIHNGEAIVAHALGSRLSHVSLENGEVLAEHALDWLDSAIGPESGDAIAQLPRHVTQGFAVAVIDQRAFIPSVAVYPGSATLEPAGYGASVEGLEPFFPQEQIMLEAELQPAGQRHLWFEREVVDVDQNRRSSGRVKEASSSTCLLPRAIVASPDKHALFVACFDSGEVLQLDRRRAPLQKAQTARALVGAGTTAIAIDQEHHELWAFAKLDRTLKSFKLNEAGLFSDVTESHALALPSAKPYAHAQGRRAFHEPRAFDGRSCASCHIDGRHDGLVWSSPAGRLQTPVLTGRLANSAPYGWHGESATIEQHIRLTLTRLRAPDASDQTLTALAEYLTAMPDYRTPARPLNATEERGKALFRSSITTCSSCHSEATSWTDGNSRKVGDDIAFDTPSLRHLGGSAPYWHDGRYASLRALLRGVDGKMGHTRHLGESDTQALIAYLRHL